jgi:protein YibB
MNEISIVTAFFDIGRGDWTPDKGLPHYLQRTTNTYFERFGYMAKLENEMFIYTSSELAPKIEELRKGKKTQIFTLDFPNSFEELKEKVSSVQKNPEYQAKINPLQIKNPEYWNTDYVVVNLLKSSFVNQSLPFVNNELVAWLDFGYCREPIQTNKWCYNFAKDKIHFFNIKNWKEGTYIQDVIMNNDVHITGPMIVANKELWPKLQHLVNHGINELINNNLIDDDQTLLLMSYLYYPDLFELHPVSSDDWFVAFKEYNENLS